MTDEVSANPSGAEPGPLYRTEDIATRLRGMLGSESATDETSADEGNAAVEGAEPAEAETQVEAEATPEEPAESPEEPQADEQPKGRYRVKVNGEEKLVTFEELRKGYQMEADYRQKTAKLSEKERALEAERTHYAEQLKGIIPALQVQLQDKFANVNWTELAKTDPAKYVEMQAEYQQYATRLQIAQAEQQRIEAQTRQQQEAALKERLQQEAAKLAEVIPDFAHPEKAKALRTELKSFLKETGYTDEEIATLSDHRAAKIAYDAMQFRKAQKAKEVAQKQSVQKNIPQVQKPGTATRTDPKLAALGAAQERFGKTGRVEDLAAVLRARRQS